MHDDTLAEEIVRQWNPLRVAEKEFGDMVERGEAILVVRVIRMQALTVTVCESRWFRHGDWVNVLGLWYTVRVDGKGRGRSVTISEVARA